MRILFVTGSRGEWGYIRPILRLIEKDPEFANKIKFHTLDLIHEKDFHEYYSCKSGTPYGANNFSWSAALYLDLINN